MPIAAVPSTLKGIISVLRRLITVALSLLGMYLFIHASIVGIISPSPASRGRLEIMNT